MQDQRPDVIVENHGSIFLFTLRSAQARAWVDEHVQEGAQYFGGALAVEHRFARALAQGMLDAGLTVQ